MVETIYKYKNIVLILQLRVSQHFSIWDPIFHISIVLISLPFQRLCTCMYAIFFLCGRTVYFLIWRYVNYIFRLFILSSHSLTLHYIAPSHGHTDFYFWHLTGTWVFSEISENRGFSSVKRYFIDTYVLGLDWRREKFTSRQPQEIELGNFRSVNFRKPYSVILDIILLIYTWFVNLPTSALKMIHLFDCFND